MLLQTTAPCNEKIPEYTWQNFVNTGICHDDIPMIFILLHTQLSNERGIDSIPDVQRENQWND